MAHSHTTNYDLIKPEVSADVGAWGAYVNTNSDTIDTAMKAIQDAVDATEVVADAALPKAGGTMSGAIVGAAISATTVTASGAFGCNGKTAQAAVAADAALVYYGSDNADLAVSTQDTVALVNTIRAALIANGILA
jgi:hypothetical protein